MVRVVHAGVEEGTAMKTILMVFFTLCLFVTSGCTVFQESHSKSISLQQVREVLGVEEDLPLPDEWEIDSIEQYNDGFVSPSVMIQYTNGVKIRLSKSKWDLSKEFNNSQSVQLGNQQIQRYSNAKEDGYVLKIRNIYYAIQSPNDQRNETEQVIEDLL